MTPILDEHTLEFVSRDPDQTKRLGARLGALLRGGDVICLEGPLGAGKTCLAQGIGRGWGASQILVSPTFVLVREYTRSAGPATLYHIDLYRIADVDEAQGVGIDEFLGDPRTICIVEWAERARVLMPSEHLWVTLRFFDHTRRTLHFTAQGERHDTLLQEFRQTAFGA